MVEQNVEGEASDKDKITGIMNMHNDYSNLHFIHKHAFKQGHV